MFQYLNKLSIIKPLILNIFLVVTLLFFLSCSKSDRSDLSVSLTIGENGAVLLSASAEGTINYRFSFEENAVYNNSNGEIEYIYNNKGNYTIAVWAFFDSNEESYSYQTIDVEIKNATGNNSNQSDNWIDSSEEVTQYVGYSLIWNDEFNYRGSPSESKWHLQYIPIDGNNWANNEKQHYTTRKENSNVSNGTLKIIALREDFTFNGNRKSYTSSRLNSKFEFQYGRVDVRAKLPSEGGTWPAIWTLGTNINEIGNFHGDSFGSVGWPKCGEIDLIEQNGWNKSIAYGTFHWTDSQTNEYSNYGEQKNISNLNISSLTENFHLYSLIWDASSLKILIDDKHLISLSNSNRAPFDNPHYILLNLAMGGNLGGDIPQNFNKGQMEIDYVRVYQ